ncbi:MAG: TetR/AcrR family transcriptional regulator [Candidatus Firestonebacteria bacterium]|nr:TetR/AcrR family transcriptional regulator [Candidatus Firestonebacteria bacterium]
MGIQERKIREKEQRKLHIINAGEKLFLKKGLENTKMDEIAKACELSKGTLYLYFRSKEELYLTIILKAMGVLYEMMQDYSLKATNPLDKFRAINEAYLVYYKKFPNYFNIITHFVDHRLLKEKLEIQDVLNEIYKVNNQIWDFITKIISECVNKGYINNKVKPIELAVIMWTSSNGMLQFMDHIKNEQQCQEDGAFLAFGFDCEDMMRKTWDIILSAVLINKTKKNKKTLEA